MFDFFAFTGMHYLTGLDPKLEQAAILPSELLCRFAASACECRYMSVIWVVSITTATTEIKCAEPSPSRSGVLLEVVQTLTEMNFVFTKAVVSSDGGWFVDGE
eukprot:545569-Pyramimonas_sp.AAC.2